MLWLTVSVMSIPVRCIAATALALVVGSPSLAQSISEKATCKLTNTEANKTLYEGACKVTQSQSGANTIFKVKMGSAEPYLFAGQRGDSNWMRGPERVQFTDLPNGAIFRWGSFALVIAE
jgi:hypothetical protein